MNIVLVLNLFASFFAISKGETDLSVDEVYTQLKTSLDFEIRRLRISFGRKLNQHKDIIENRLKTVKNEINEKLSGIEENILLKLQQESKVDSGYSVPPLEKTVPSEFREYVTIVNKALAREKQYLRNTAEYLDGRIQNIGQKLQSFGGESINHDAKGQKGEPGYPGIPGLMGMKGIKGEIGSPCTGPQGPECPQGPDGPRGPPGLQGLPGFPGEKGEKGIGQKGPEGPRGLDGPIGRPGKPGAHGFPGRDGLPGQRGEKGSIGLPGVAYESVKVKHVSFTVRRVEKGSPMSSKQRIVFDEVLNNNMNGYSSYTGIFVAPVSGMYLFIYYIEIKENYAEVDLMVGESIVSSARAFGKTSEINFSVSGFSNKVTFGDDRPNEMETSIYRNLRCKRGRFSVSGANNFVNIQPNRDLCPDGDSLGATGGNAAITLVNKGEKVWIQTSDISGTVNIIPPGTTFTGILLFEK